MINKFLFFFVLLLSQVGHCNLIVQRIDSGVFFVRGTIDENNLVPYSLSPRSTFYVNIYETDDSFYDHKDSSADYCLGSKEDVAKYMNDKLRPGLSVTRAGPFSVVDPTWTVSVQCQSGQNTAWMIKERVAALPPGRISCSVSHPTTVSFGSVTLGGRKDIYSQVRISCTNPADATVTMSKSTVNLDDAVVNYYFPGDKKYFSARVKKFTPTIFNIRYALEATGNTLGYKSGSAVMTVNWQ